MAATAKTRARKDRGQPVEAASALSIANLERDLLAVTRRHAQAADREEQAAAERDRVIRDAHAAGLGPTRIAELTGLSIQRIDQIRRGARL